MLNYFAICEKEWEIPCSLLTLIALLVRVAFPYHGCVLYVQNENNPSLNLLF